MQALVAAIVLMMSGCAGSEQASATPKPTVPVATPSASPSPALPLPSPTAASVKSGSFKVTKIAGNLRSPVYITNAGDGSGRLFIVEQAGRILVLKDGSLLGTPFLDIRSLVASGGERGLLSVAFHPDFAANGVFVVNYTRASSQSALVGDTIIARYRVSPAWGDVADRASGQTLLVIDQPQANHNGGLVMFAPDGTLYIGMGDGGAGGDIGTGHAAQGNGQSLTTLLGKMLRISVGANGPYTIPSNNPNLGSGTRREIWSYGLRNPWRFSFDRATGDMYIADVGQNAWEEVNFQPAASKGGENYGWPAREGTHVYRADVRPARFVGPVAEYSHATGGCSVTGGYVYRGSRIPAMYGFYVFGDYCSGMLWTLVRFGGRWVMSPLMRTAFLVSSFGEDESGELYLVNLSGAIYRFDPR